MIKTLASLIACAALAGFVAPAQAQTGLAWADTAVLGEGCEGGKCTGDKKKDQEETSQATNCKGDKCEGGKKKDQDTAA